MADDVLTMVARLRDETPSAFQQIQDSIKKTAQHPGIRELGQRFKELGDTLKPVAGVLKDAIMPTLETLGITSLSVSGVIGGLTYGLARFSTTALNMKVVADQARITTTELQRLTDTFEELGVPAEQAVDTVARLGKTFLEMTAGPGGIAVGGAEALYKGPMMGFGQRGLEHFEKIREHLLKNPGDTKGAIRMIFEAGKEMELSPDRYALWVESWGIPKKAGMEFLEVHDRIGERIVLNDALAKEYNKQWQALSREADDFAKTIFNYIGPTMTNILKETREAWHDWQNSKPPAWFAYLMTENPAEKLKKIFEGINRTPLKTEQGWFDWLLHGPPPTTPGPGQVPQETTPYQGGTGGGTGDVQTAPTAPATPEQIPGGFTPRPGEQGTPPIAPGTQGPIPPQGPGAPETLPGAPQPMQPTTGVFGFGKGSPADLFSGKTPGEFAWGTRAPSDTPLSFQSGTQQIDTTGSFPGSRGGGGDVSDAQRSEGMRNLADAFKRFQPPQGGGAMPGQEGTPPADTFSQRFGGMPAGPAIERADQTFGGRPADEGRTFGPTASIPGWVRKEGPDLFSGATPGSFQQSTEAMDKALWFQSGQQEITGGADISIDVNGASGKKNGGRRPFRETTINRSQMMGPADTASDGDTKSPKFGVE